MRRIVFIFILSITYATPEVVFASDKILGSKEGVKMSQRVLELSRQCISQEPNLLIRLVRRANNQTTVNSCSTSQISNQYQNLIDHEYQDTLEDDYIFRLKSGPVNSFTSLNNRMIQIDNYSPTESMSAKNTTKKRGIQLPGYGTISGN